MSRNVKGSLFVDYVRMIRSQKAVDWKARFPPSDHKYLQQRIPPGEWYPMETFERFGLAILKEVAGGDLEMVRAWGKLSVDMLHQLH